MLKENLVSAISKATIDNNRNYSSKTLEWQGHL